MTAVALARDPGAEALVRWRRDVEHQLHTSVQQQLAALALQARTLGRETGAADRDLAQLIKQVDAVLGQVRDLAESIFPAALVHADLAAALRTLRRRAPVVVDLDLVDLGPVDPVSALAAHDVAAGAIAGAEPGGPAIWLQAATTDGSLTMTVAPAPVITAQVRATVAALGGRLSSDHAGDDATGVLRLTTVLPT